ncbi:MAG: hypothetical protein AB7O97_19805 [Planctomycetota bacterium]
MLSLALVTLLVPQSQWVVDAAGGPGVDFVDLPPAVAAATHGDTILVRAGTYAPFQVTGKALTIRGAGAGPSIVRHPDLGTGSAIRAVPAGSVFHLQGLEFAPPSAARIADGELATLLVQNAAGVVSIAHCRLLGGQTLNTQLATDALQVDHAAVYAFASRFAGGRVSHFFSLTSRGGHGIEATNGALVVATDCELLGGDASTLKGSAAIGGAGLELNSALATLHDCRCRGGSGSAGRGVGTGGAGVHLGSLGSFARLAGGAPAEARAGAGSRVSGVAIDVTAGAGTVVVHDDVTLVPVAPGDPLVRGAVTLGAPHLPRLLVSSLPTPNGELPRSQRVDIDVVLDGAFAGAPVLFAFAAAPQLAAPQLPFTLGELVLPPTRFAAAALLDGAGTFHHEFPPPTTPALLDQPVFAQAAVLDVAAGRVRLSNFDVHLHR